jgi:hypothetical protein
VRARRLRQAAAYPAVASNFYPVLIGVWRSVMPCWAVVVAVREVEPSMDARWR